jgi:hypothetical protein
MVSMERVLMVSMERTCFHGEYSWFPWRELVSMESTHGFHGGTHGFHGENLLFPWRVLMVSMEVLMVSMEVLMVSMERTYCFHEEYSWRVLISMEGTVM